MSEAVAGQASGQSSLRIELALRAARLGKACLEIVGMDPSMVRLQLCEIVSQVREIEECVGKGGRT